MTGFLNQHLTALQQKKVALFVTGLRLVKTPDCDDTPYPIFIDPSILPENQSNKNLLDGYTTMKRYLNRALPTIEKIRPVSLAFFAGKLDMQTLRMPEELIMALLMLLTGKQLGDYRNWASIRAWADDLFREEVSEVVHEQIAYIE